MIKVYIPNDNLLERKYTIDILLGEFLGLEYSIKVDSGCSNYKIVIENGNKLIIEDSFFGKFKNVLKYLNKHNIPQKIDFTKNKFIIENDIPIIYGTNKLLIANHQQTITITCGIDIFASSFFMLTRWEEYVNKTRDKHNRFPAYASLAYKHNFLDRPIVNEYVEMLWNMLKFLGCKQKRKKREFKLILTHDIDHAFKYTGFLSGLREILGDVIKRKNLPLAFRNSLDKLLTHLRLRRDPFDTYDYLMDISEQIGVKSYFFLHSSKYSKYDNDNDKYLKRIAKKILNRGHYLGYHPSYESYNNFEIFLRDKERIENMIEHKLTFGRQHYLRFEVPTTWQIWEKAGMEWDSTLGYADKEGFRCGTCYSYSVFDIINRRKQNLKEKPLILMDDTFVSYYLYSTSEEMEEKIDSLARKIEKYNGEFVLLWHNSSFNGMFKKFTNIYKSIKKYTR